MIAPVGNQHKRLVTVCFVLLMAIVGLGAKTYELHFEVQGLRTQVREAVYREAETSRKVEGLNVSVAALQLLLPGSK